MSLELAAKHLAAQGRGPDKQLVHMSPREVAGLQALAMSHGGSLSINPKTGLPEAGFLDSILPAVVGAGLAFATGGTSLALTPAMIGLGVGGIQALRTGDLSKGLMAGLGAYGGAGLFAGLAGAGAAGAGAAGAGAAGAGAAGAAGAIPQAVAAPGFDVAGLASSPVDVSQLASPGVTAAEAAGRQSVTDFMASKGVGLGPTGEIVSVTPSFPPTVTPAPAPVTSPRGFLDGMSDVAAVEGPGVSGAGLPTRSTTLASRFDAMPTQDKFKYGLAALSPALLAQPEAKQPELDREQYRYAYTPGPAMPPTRMGDVGEYTYFRPSYTRLAAGGPVEAMSAANVYDMQNARGGVSDMGIDNSTGMQKMAVGGVAGYDDGGAVNAYTYDPMTQNYSVANPSDATQGMSGFGPFRKRINMAGLPAAAADTSTYTYDPTTQTYTAVAPAASSSSESNPDYGSYDQGVSSGGGMAKGGGISDLGDYSDGGRLLRGPGDGVSDSIPAVIGRKRPARLADGEFVVPARIVSELGNGSTDAGARKLYAMMDRIQKARGKTVGKGKVAKNSRAEKYLPA